MGQLKPGVKYIYERQGGHIYAREFGADPSTRIEIGYDYELEDNASRVRGVARDDMIESQLWHEIRQTAKTNTSLQAELDRVKMLYYLIKENEKSIAWHPV